MKSTGLKREKACRTFGQKMLLTERCATPKCAFTRRSTKPGAHGQSKRRRMKSEYGQQLVEKQRLRVTYGISEKALKRSVREALNSTGGTSIANRNILDVIAEQLEGRLDNVVYRLGFAPSRSIARQMVSHGHFLVNDRKATTPSISVRVGMKIRVRPESIQKAQFTEVAVRVAKQRLPAWLSADAKTLTGTVIAIPSRQEATSTLDLAKVVEFYAR